MCEILGFSGSRGGCIEGGLHRLADHSDRNPHGWGLACYDHGIPAIVKKAAEARHSPEYYEAARRARGDIVISHIRNASCGGVSESNCHPFHREMAGVHWIFAHNGQIDGLCRHPLAGGDTDSESAFNVILDHVADGGEAADGIARGIASIFEDYEFGRQVGLNFVMSDGRDLYAFSHHAEKPMYIAREGGGTAVATRRLDGYAWEAVPADRLLVLRGGGIRGLSPVI